MKIACGTVLFRQHPLEKALDAIKAIGYDYVETQSVGPWCPHVNVETDDPVRYAELVKSYGFKGTTALWMRNGQLISNPDVVVWAKRTLEWAKAAGIPVVNTGDGFKSEDMTDADAMKLYRDRIAEILETCVKLDMTIAIEPHGTFSLTADGLTSLMAASQDPHLAVNYDACNIYRASYIESKGDAFRAVQIENRDDEVAVLSRVVHRVAHVHAKDYLNGRCAPLGEGNVKIAECLAELKQFGYSGAVSLETEGDESFEVSREFARKGFAFLKAHV